MPSHSQPLLILKTGSTFPSLAQDLGDFEDWIADGLALSAADLRVVDARCHPLPSPEGLAGVVVTGSHAMVSEREPWSESSAEWLRGAVLTGLPVLGICYGHQLLAHCLGGEVGYHPGGIEIGSVTVALLPASEGDALLGDLPSAFPVQVVHRQSVRRLPQGAVCLAGNAHEPNQAFRFGAAAWGVQFHPEFSVQAMQAYIGRLAPELCQEGLEPAQIQAQVVPTPVAAGILRRFAAHVWQEPPVAV